MSVTEMHEVQKKEKEKILPIIFKPLHHRGGEQLAIYFPFKKEIDYAVRSLKGVKWSHNNKCWYLPLNKEAFEKAILKLSLSGK